MICPIAKCNSLNTTVYKTFGPNHPQMKRLYAGMNVVRRQRVCSDCGAYFYTIELLEEDFNRSCVLSGRLETGARIG